MKSTAMTARRKPTPSQRDALTHAIASTGRLIYCTGGYWTTDACAAEHVATGAASYAWSCTRGTVVAMVDRGWLVTTGTHRDSPRVVTDAGRAALLL